MPRKLPRVADLGRHYINWQNVQYSGPTRSARLFCLNSFGVRGMARTIGEVPGVMQDQQWVGGATLDRDVVVGQLERILSSDDFDASPRSRAFFSFIVEET